MCRYIIQKRPNFYDLIPFLRATEKIRFSIDIVRIFFILYDLPTFVLHRIKNDAKYTTE